MFDPNPWNALFVFRAFEMHADERATARRAPKRSRHVKRRLMRLYVRATRAMVAQAQSASRATEHPPHRSSEPIVVR